MPGVLRAIHDLFNHPKLRKVFLTLRIPLSLGAIVLLLFHIDPVWFPWGLAVSAVGALFQLWCFGCIKTHKILAVEGPYMFMRNPMYVARFILVLGAVLFTGNLWVVGVFVVLYALYAVNRVRREEAKLKVIFAEDYAAYCRDVPRFRPTLKRFRLAGLRCFEWDFFQRNHGLVNLAGVLVFYALSYVWEFVLGW